MRRGRESETWRSDILAAVLSICRDHQGDEGAPLGTDDEMAEAGLDSLRLVSILVQVEDRLGVSFPPELISGETFRTPRTLADAVALVRADMPDGG
jgi:acyl carrier protein